MLIGAYSDPSGKGQLGFDENWPNDIDLKHLTDTVRFLTALKLRECSFPVGS